MAEEDYRHDPHHKKHRELPNINWIPPPLQIVQEQKGCVQSLCEFLDRLIKKIWLLLLVVFFLPLLIPTVIAIYEFISFTLKKKPPESFISSDQYDAIIWVIVFSSILGLVLGVIIRIFRKFT